MVLNNATNAATLQTALSECGYRVETTDQAEQAISLVLKKGFDFIIAENHLEASFISGLDLVGTIRNSQLPKIENIPIIILLKENDVALVNQLKAANVSGLLFQPIQVIKLMEMMQAMLMRRGFDLSHINKCVKAQRIHLSSITDNAKLPQSDSAPPVEILEFVPERPFSAKMNLKQLFEDLSRKAKDHLAPLLTPEKEGAVKFIQGEDILNQPIHSSPLMENSFQDSLNIFEKQENMYADKEGEFARFFADQGVHHVHDKDELILEAKEIPTHTVDYATTNERKFILDEHQYEPIDKENSPSTVQQKIHEVWEQANYLGLTRKALWGLGIMAFAIAFAAFFSLGVIQTNAVNYVAEQIKDFGKNTSWIQLSKGSLDLDVSTGIDNRDLYQLQQGQCSACKFVTPIVFGPYRRVMAQKDNYSSVIELEGVDVDYFKINNDTAIKGRILQNEDISLKTHVAILGEAVLKDLFKEEDPIGKTIRVGKLKLIVVGVLKAKQIDFLVKLGSEKIYDFNHRILVPYTFYQEKLGTSAINWLQITSVSEESNNKAITEVIDLLRKNHRTTVAFDVESSRDWMNQSGNFIRNMSYFLIGIAVICLMIGGAALISIIGPAVVKRMSQRQSPKSVNNNFTQRGIWSASMLDSMFMSLSSCTLGIALGFLINYSLWKWLHITPQLPWVWLIFGFLVTLGLCFFATSHTVMRTSKNTLVHLSH